VKGVVIVATHASCICTRQECGHPEGERCGKAVEHADKASFIDRNGQEVGEEFLLGMCDDCLDTAGIRRRQMS